MVYILISLTIIIYFFIVIRIFHGIQDEKTVSIVTKIKNAIKSKRFNTLNSDLK